MIAVRQFTNGADVLAHAREISRKRFAPRQITPTRVLPAPEKAADEPIVAPGTRQDCERFRLFGDAYTSQEVLLGLLTEMRALREEVAAFKQSVTRRIVEDEGAQEIPAAIIRGIVLETFGISRCELESQRKSNALLLPRYAFIWLVRKHTRMSYPQIGRLLSGRDHTTMLNACRKCESLMAEKDAYRAQIEAMSLRIETEMGA